MAKRRKNGQMSDKELEVRRHHASLRRLKAHCSNENVVLKNYESANPDDMFLMVRVYYHQKMQIWDQEKVI